MELVQSSRIRELKDKAKAFSKSFPAISWEEMIVLSDIQNLPDIPRMEEMTSEDWTRVGVVLGLLWTRFDRMLEKYSQLIGVVDDVRKGIDRVVKNTDRIK